MPTLGEELRRRREQLNIDLNDIADSTKIGIRFLKAIEADNYAILPGGIFTRSFIRAFAKKVGMNEDEAMNLYVQQVAPPPVIEQPEDNHKKSSKQPPSIIQAYENQPPVIRKKPAKTSTETNWSSVLIIIGILIVVGIIIAALVRQINKNQAAQVVIPEKPRIEQPQAEEPSQSASSQNSSQPTPTAEPPQAPSVNAGDTLKVRIEAKDNDIWIQYQADEAKPAQVILKPGEGQDVPPALSAVKIKYGNKQSLKLIINNKEANLPVDLPEWKGNILISRDTLPTFFQTQSPAPPQ
ncbi:MAG: helix-turn-helix transcriptional regulator [Acidobacteriota bacterium]